MRLSLLLVPAVVPVFSVWSQEKVTYQDHIRPLFENRCLNCHNPDKKKGGLDLSTYGNALAGGSGGVCVEAGDGTGSKMVQCVKYEAEPFMPPKSDKIPQAEIDLIIKWINGGLLETSGSTAKVKKKQNFEMAAANPTAKPEGPPPMPEHLLLDPVVVPPRPDVIKSFALNPWAPLLAVASEGQVLLFHSENGDLLGVLPFPEGKPECVGFTRNGSIVFAGGGRAGKSGMVALWEVKTGKRIATVGEEFDSVLGCDVSPDHKLVALGGPGKKVRIYSTASGEKLVEIKKHTDWVMHCVFSPDGVLLATGDRNGGLYVWESATGNEFYTLKGHEKAINSIAWRPDSNLVASASEDGTVRWWEMQGGTQVKSFPAHGGAGVLSVGYALDGRLITGGRDGKVRLFKPDGTQAREFVPADGSMILCCAYTPDGKRCATGAENGQLKIWDCEKEAKDSPPLAILANPPAIETRLARLNQELAGKQSLVQQAQAAVAEKEKQVTAAKTEAEAAQARMAAMQKEMEKTAQVRDQLQSTLTRLTETRTNYTGELEAVKKQLATLQHPPAAPPTTAPDPGVSEPVRNAIQQATQAQTAANAVAIAVAQAKLDDLTEILTRHDAEIAQIQQRMPQVEGQAAALAGNAAEIQKSLEPKKQAIDAAMKVYTDAKAGADAATAQVAGFQPVINRWLAAKENKTVLFIRSEVNQLKETVQALKEEIPALETEISKLNQQKAASPPPPAELLPKLDRQLAAAVKRLGEVKQELAASEPQMSDKTKLLDEALKKYLSLLPK
ncbi:MAG: hypothetical protein KA004_13205 [Verrucomicrobiales bacterium]|nr:hypothetical protein [Verrucomicrobiales bacterium]